MKKKKVNNKKSLLGKNIKIRLWTTTSEDFLSQH